MKRLILIILAQLFIITLGNSQDMNKQSFNLLIERQEAVEALSLYPEPIRSAILESTLQPGILIKLNNIQNSIGDSFNSIIENFSEEEQRKFWELTKYDSLIEKIVELKPKRKEEISEIIMNYPKSIHNTALELGTNHFSVLEKVNSLSMEAQESIDKVLEEYPIKSQESFRILLKNPEIIHLLSDNLELTILVGEYYSKNPGLVHEIADSIQIEASKRYAEEVAEWEKGLSENPEALQEFEKISNEFVGENADIEDDPLYSGVNQTSEELDNTPQKSEERVDIYHHYPFWFGYPMWYPNSYWYWYPYWYHWGYYYGTGNSIIIVGMPSYFFMNWYFAYPYHHHLYPHFSDYVIRHYTRAPRIDRTGFRTAVREWENRSSSRVVRELIADDTRRVERFKEYGRFEQDYQRRLENRPNTTADRDVYLRNSSRRYPNLNGGTRNTISNRNSFYDRTISRPASPTRSYEINRARDLHQRTWERSNLRTQPTLPRTRTSTPVPRSRSNTNSRSRSGG
ncbi:MAG: hypothetical protein ACQETL_02685 [Bacteroidota bacterium]